MNTMCSRVVLNNLINRKIINKNVVVIRNKSMKRLALIRPNEAPTDVSDSDIAYAEKYILQIPGGEVFISKEYWSEGIALLCINNTEKGNSLTGKMMVDLRRCIIELGNWKNGKAVILYGKGSNFCSGGVQDFSKIATTPTSGTCISIYMLDILKRFRKLPLVSVSLVHGQTSGGGAELAVFTDYMVVSENARVAFNNGKMGIITAWGGTSRLVQVVGERTALEVLLSGKIYDAAECVDLGLASRIVDTNNRMQEGVKFLKNYTAYSSAVVQSYKNVVKCIADQNFETSLDFENREFINQWREESRKTK